MEQVAMESGSFRPHPLNDEYKCLEVSTPVDSPHVTVVSLNRPHKRNAINASMWKEIGHIFSSALGRSGDDCRCVLLRGNGRGFSSGIDVMDDSFLTPLLVSSSEDRSDEQTDIARRGLAFLPKLREMQDCFSAVERCPVPVVAAIHGQCIGAGIDLICSTDIRLCVGPDDASCHGIGPGGEGGGSTVFSVREVALGLAADVGTLQRLPKIAGNQSVVRDVCLTARSFGSREAIRMGMVSRAVPTEDLLWSTAMKICSDIARHSPVAIHGTKKALLYARDHSVEDGLEQIAVFNAMALQSPDLATAFAAAAAAKKEAGPAFATIPAYSKL